MLAPKDTTRSRRASKSEAWLARRAERNAREEARRAGMRDDTRPAKKPRQNTHQEKKPE